MAEIVEYQAQVFYAANREPIDGNFGPYHDAVFAVYDPETGTLLDDEDDRVRVFVDADGKHEDELDALLDLQKGDEVTLLAQKSRGKWKWSLKRDAGSRGGGGGGPLGNRGGGNSRGGGERGYSPRGGGGGASRPVGRGRDKENDNGPVHRDRGPARSEKKDPLTMPDPDTIDRMLNKGDMLAQILARLYTKLAQEFAEDLAQERLDQAFMPTSDNITSMAQSVFIHGARDEKWLITR